MGNGNVSAELVPLDTDGLIEEPCDPTLDGFLHFAAWSVMASVALCNCDEGIEEEEMKYKTRRP